LYGAAGSGSVAVEAALTLLELPFTLVDGATWKSDAARERVAKINPMRQIPTLVLPSGEVMTESAAMLIYLADLYPDARLAPKPAEPLRGQFLRWMSFVSSAIYSLHWIKPDVQRIGAAPSARDAVVNAVHDRIERCWSFMDAQLYPRTFLLGDDLSVLDLYVAVISRFGPWRERFERAAPRMADAMHRVDSDPRLAQLWQERFSEL
jgi:GST-like protein